MRRSKKIIFISLLALVVLAGTIGGIALANDDEDTSQSQTRGAAFLNKVCEFYNTANPEAPIDCDELQKACDQARSETMTEARNQFRQSLIDEGKMTAEQFEEMDKWMESRPKFSTDEFDAWLNEMPEMPFEMGPRGGGRFHDFGMMSRGFPRLGGPCAPIPAE